MTAISCQSFQLPLFVVCHMNGFGYVCRGGQKPRIVRFGIETSCTGKSQFIQSGR